MKTDDFTEYSRFYDFSKSQQNYTLKEVEINAVSNLKRNEGIIEVVSDNGEDEDDEWIDEEEEEEKGEEGGDVEEGEEVEKGVVIASSKQTEVESAQQQTLNGEVKEDPRADFRKVKKEQKIKRYVVPKIEVLESGEIRLASGFM